jgi:predicted DCC family thiol-disulfide oxidoreductase YuxK
MDHPILLYDGVCYLCNWLVRFAIKHDAHGRLRFSSLQSAKGRELLEANGIPAGDLDTVLLIEDGRVYDRSTCALRALRYLRFPWPLAYALIIVPRFIRDAVYDFVARKRYAWFGRMDSCPIPPPELRERFLA